MPSAAEIRKAVLGAPLAPGPASWLPERLGKGELLAAWESAREQFAKLEGRGDLIGAQYFDGVADTLHHVMGMLPGGEDGR